MDWFQIWIVDLDPVFLSPILTLQMLVWYCSSVSRISWRDHAGASWNQILFNKYKLIWHTCSQQHTPRNESENPEKVYSTSDPIRPIQSSIMLGMISTFIPLLSTGNFILALDCMMLLVHATALLLGKFT